MLMLQYFAAILFPEKCISCGKYPRIICNTCKTKLEHHLPECMGCKTYSENFTTHSNCLETNTIKNLFVCYKYNSITEKLIIALKFKSKKIVAKEIANLIFLSPNIPKLENYMLIPTPIHWQRRNERGYNQCEEILKQLNILHNRNLDVFNCLEKTQNSKHQTGATKKVREKNLVGSIGIKTECLEKLNTSTKPIIIFDDICTTGSTLNECSKIISKKTNADISALVFSRG